MQPLAFQKISPESAGISSRAVVEFLRSLEDLGLATHSILIAKGDDLVCEAYYAPYHAGSLHRAYSVSKSFIAAAVGVAVKEGLFSLDDVILDYFPEFQNDHTLDGFYQRCRVRDMLQMSSNIGSNVYWWGKFATRTEAYYSQDSVKAPGQLYYYDSIGCFLLGNMIQKLTGKNFLEYLKEKALLELGFSADSTILTEPGGFGVGDSGVLCTARDFLVLARLFAKEGVVNGKVYLDPEYAREAIAPRMFNDLGGGMYNHRTAGYGYLIWGTPEGFAFVGAGDQYAFYDKQHDLTFVIHSDNQGMPSSGDMIYHNFAAHFLPTVCTSPLEEDPVARAELEQYEASRQLLLQYGSADAPIKSQVDGVRYRVELPNAMGIEAFGVKFFQGGGRFFLVRQGKELGFDFGFGENKRGHFSFGMRAKADQMGVNVEGEYDCAGSAGFVNETTLAIKLQVIDTYLGKLQVTIGFGPGEASMYISKQGQYVFDGMIGYVFGRAEKEEEET